MTFQEEILTLPAHQREAARELYVHPDERLIADAMNAGVPAPIISYLSGRAARHVREITLRINARDVRCVAVD
jgi:hypothetical protein